MPTPRPTAHVADRTLIQCAKPALERRERVTISFGITNAHRTFGAMLANSVAYFKVVPTYLFIPGTILVIIVVAFNLFGDALRDALDPRVTH